MGQIGKDTVGDHDGQVSDLVQKAGVVYISMSSAIGDWSGA